MKRAIVLTVGFAPFLLKDVLESWKRVRGFWDWPLHVHIENSRDSRWQSQAIEQLRDLQHPRMTITVSPRYYGRQESNYQALDRALTSRGYDFVVMAQDNELVSTDILEFFDWASLVFETDPRVLTVQSNTDREGPEDGVELRPDGHLEHPVYATWADRWNSQHVYSLSVYPTFPRSGSSLDIEPQEYRVYESAEASRR